MSGVCGRRRLAKLAFVTGASGRPRGLLEEPVYDTYNNYRLTDPIALHAAFLDVNHQQQHKAEKKLETVRKMWQDLLRSNEFLDIKTVGGVGKVLDEIEKIRNAMPNGSELSDETAKKRLQELESELDFLHNKLSNCEIHAEKLLQDWKPLLRGNEPKLENASEALALSKEVPELKGELEAIPVDGTNMGEILSRVARHFEELPLGQTKGFADSSVSLSTSSANPSVNLSRAFRIRSAPRQQPH